MNVCYMAVGTVIQLYLAVTESVEDCLLLDLKKGETSSEIKNFMKHYCVFVGLVIVGSRA